MSGLSRFLKKNKVQKQNAKYAATRTLVDEDGKPLEWELRPLSTRESEQIRIALQYGGAGHREAGTVPPETG